MEKITREDIEALTSLIVFVLIPAIMLLDLFFGSDHRHVNKEGD